ncbi:MAG: hypothetical protein JXA03_05895 [Bacteroidales bacterium]|nr:hypothetical protein [Bacteroidales bacterium]
MKKYKTHKNPEVNRDTEETLSGIPKTNDKYFTVPEGYFETLHVRIMDRISERERPPLWLNLLSLFRKPAYYLPAGVLTLALIFLVFFRDTLPIGHADLQYGFSWEEIISEAPELAYTLDDQAILEIFMEGYSLRPHRFDFDFDNVFETGLQEDVIIHYLQDQNISDNLLYEL